MSFSLRIRPSRMARKSSEREHVRPLENKRATGKKRPRRRATPRPTEGEVNGDVRRRMRPRKPTTPTLGAPPRRAGRRSRRRTQVSRPSTRARRRFNLYALLSWRAVSGVIVVGLVVVLYLFLTTDTFYVNAVAIGGEKYLSREEIFRYSDIARKHIFWIDPQEVEARLEAVPNIADATVVVGWPPDMVQILVVEREPALTWEQQVRVWVDVNGIVMKQREDRPDLLRIVVPDATEPISVGQRIPQAIVDGALLLKRRYPNIEVLLYDTEKGLGYRDGRGWTVWYGTGEDMDTKLRVYTTLVEAIYPTVQPGEIVMSDPDRPYYTVLWRNE